MSAHVYRVSVCFGEWDETYGWELIDWDLPLENVSLGLAIDAADRIVDILERANAGATVGTRDWEFVTNRPDQAFLVQVLSAHGHAEMEWHRPSLGKDWVRA